MLIHCGHWYVFVPACTGVSAIWVLNVARNKLPEALQLWI